MSTIIGRISIAPCGHTGEVIVGTYVKCSQGCEGPATIPVRGEIGHVLNCACKPCQLRRLAVKVVLRTDKGQDHLVVDWNGTDDLIQVENKTEAIIRHYQFLDAEGKIIARGDTTATIFPGNLKIRVKTMLDGIVGCVVAKGAVFQSLSDVIRITITLNNAPSAPNVWAGFSGVGIP